MTTIRDVAKRARVSVTAASYALNDTGTISEATRKRVFDAASELNYHPNAHARHLKKRSTLTIGVFITRFGGSFYEEILEGIHDAVLETDYEMIVCPESRAIRKTLIHRQVDGAIVFDTKVKSELILRLASEKFPIVVLDRYLETDYLYPLLIDNKQGVREAFDHLFGQGFRRIAFVAGAMDSFDNRERMSAFLGEGDKHDLVIPCYYGDFTEKSGYSVGLEIIQTGHLPEAVFCANDQMAIGFIRAMKENGLNAPGNIAIVGFDDIEVTRYMQPTLSTISSSRHMWGHLAASQLIESLEKGRPIEAHRLPTCFIPRESSTRISKP